MKIGITYRYAEGPTGRMDRLYIPGEFKNIFDELDVTLIPIVSESGLDEIVDICDGLIVPGSFADTNPRYYNEEPLKDKTYDVDEYKFDSLIISKFEKKNKPILGICGGHQEINVYFGGTLNQRIENHGNGIMHSINIEKDSFLYEVYRVENAIVNSFHHQSIKEVAPNFKVIATSDDGTIEAIEKDNILCVQYHPEIMRDINFFKTYLDNYYKK